MGNLIKPHGGQLVNRIFSPQKREEILNKINDYKSLILNQEQVKDVKNIARGVYSPLKGFLKEIDFQRVVTEMRLNDGTVFSIPVVLDINEKQYQTIAEEKDILLKDGTGKPIALLIGSEIYSYDKDFLAENVFGTKNQNHPGVSAVYEMGDYLVSGEIWLIDNSKEPFPEYNFSPAETRKIFEEKGWEKIVAFQTRNVPHRGHEFLQLEALKRVDGLFIQPVVGEKKEADFKDEYILAAYEVLIDRYYPKDRTILAVLPLKMRYAGPREAIFHAIIRKNFGCTHFIVGRDHAGVGNYYPPFAAQEIFEKFGKEEIGIEIIKFPEVIFCPVENRHMFITDCCHSEKISFSGTALREFIKNKDQPPAYLLRSEVYFFLSQSANALVDKMYKNCVENRQKSFVLWFTGLSGSGKTTVADAVFRKLQEKGIISERLDGDIIRQYLSYDLGFSKKDRDENIRRISFVIKSMSKKGVAVIASFISPYQNERREVRKQIESVGGRFIEVFCDCPLEVCEARDAKGLYAKARRGEIKNFTGISDPYEKPENPEIRLDTSENGEENIKRCVNQVINFLNDNELI